MQFDNLLETMLKKLCNRLGVLEDLSKEGKADRVAP